MNSGSQVPGGKRAIHRGRRRGRGGKRQRWRFREVTLELPLLEIRIAPPPRNKSSGSTAPLIKQEPIAVDTHVEPKKNDLPWYATLVVNASEQHQNEAVILTSQTPFRTAYLHNADPNAGVSDRPLQASPGQWQLEMAIGPFALQTEVEAFCRPWRGCRGIQSRRGRGIELAKKWRECHPELRCHDKRIAPVDPNSCFRDMNLEDLVLDEEQYGHYRNMLIELAAEATKKPKRKSKSRQV